MKFPSLNDRLRMALAEDRAFQDLTSNQITGIRKRSATAVLMAKASGIFCGGFLARPLFQLLDPRVRVQILKKDGSQVRPGQILARIQSHAYALLAGERTFLNLACHLSGISTLTHQYVRVVRGTKTNIIDTRKTTPLWRDLEKLAVTCGGGKNHRMNLSDAVLVKDNHLSYLSNAGQAVDDVFHAKKIRKHDRSIKFVEIEAKTLFEVRQAIRAQADIVLLDNMPLSLLNEAVSLVRKARKMSRRSKPLIEISGGVTLKTAPRLAKLGAERISVGALTHSAASLDLSLEVIS